MKVFVVQGMFSEGLTPDTETHIFTTFEQAKKMFDYIVAKYKYGYADDMRQQDSDYMIDNETEFYFRPESLDYVISVDITELDVDNPVPDLSDRYIVAIGEFHEMENSTADYYASFDVIDDITGKEIITDFDTMVISKADINAYRKYNLGYENIDDYTIARTIVSMFVVNHNATIIAKVKEKYPELFEN